jgi:hypothetical protein
MSAQRLPDLLLAVAAARRVPAAAAAALAVPLSEAVALSVPLAGEAAVAILTVPVSAARLKRY